MGSRFLLVTARLAAETDRANAAERQVADLFGQIRLLHKDKLQLRAELAKSHQELQLWKVQLDLAQKEILRAQAVVDQIDRARVDAEDQASRYRRRVRQLVEERSIQTAIDEGRRVGFQEGLELGRRTRPPSRRDSTRTPAPPPILEEPHRPNPIPVHNAHNTYQVIQESLESGRRTRAPPRRDSARTPAPPPIPEEPHHPNLAPVHNAPESVHITYQVPPDNFIPVIHQGEPGIMLPPPHEWINRPKSEGQSAPPPTPVPESTQANHHSRSSSPISQFDILGTPVPKTQPERIADEWRAQNLDVVTPPPMSDTSTKIRTAPQNDVVVIPRPKSTVNHLNAKLIPPQRPMTTEPTSVRSNTPKSGTRSSRKQSRQPVLPVPVPNIFYEPPPTSTTPKPVEHDWLKSQFSLSKQRQGSPTNTERTVVDPATHGIEREAGLHGSAKKTSLSPLKNVLINRAPSVAPTALSSTASNTNYRHLQFNHNNTLIPDPPMLTVPPLSPIPTLSNLKFIPETRTRSMTLGTSVGTTSDVEEDEDDSGLAQKQQQQQEPYQYQNHRPPSRRMTSSTKPSSSSVISLSISTKEKEKNNDTTTSVMGPSSNHLSGYYQNYSNYQYHPHHHHQQGPMDIVVMNSRVESSPRIGNEKTYARGGGGEMNVSPAPLDRRLSIFDDI